MADDIEDRCEGWRRYGGAFTLGIPEWEQCKNPGTVLVHLNGEKEPMPCCNTCWQEIIDTGKQTIISVIPITGE